MKIITFGTWSIWLYSEYATFFYGYGPLKASRPCSLIYGDETQQPFVTEGLTDYSKKRKNGTRADIPKNMKLTEEEHANCLQTDIPYDGKTIWIKGRVEGERVYGVKNDEGCYEYEVRYEPSERDKAWLLEWDQNYLERLQDERKLIIEEPIIWYLRYEDKTKSNIRDWWAEMLTKPDLAEILRKGEIRYNRFYKCCRIRTLCIEKRVREAQTTGYVRISEIINKCNLSIALPANLHWYNHPELPENIPMHDFSFHAKDVFRSMDLRILCELIEKNPHVKEIDFSGVDLSKDYKKLVKLFKKRNDFVTIILNNTCIDDDIAKELLEALNYNAKERGIPLIANIVLTDNNIEDINTIIVFIEAYISNFIKYQEQQNTEDSEFVVISPPALTLINLQNNLINESKGLQTGDEPDRNWIKRQQRKLHKLSSKCIVHLKLTIILTGNVIASFSSFSENEETETQQQGISQNRYGFFISAPLEQRRSVMDQNAYLTPIMGFVSLVSKSNTYIGHASIYVELLNSYGQLEMMKLELFSRKSYSSGNQVMPSDGKSYISRLDPKRVKDAIVRKTIHCEPSPLETRLIYQLIENVRIEHAQDTVRYSIDGIMGHNCATWAIEKLRQVNVPVENRIIPVLAASRKSLKEVYCVVM
jgi:hypothetical protein